jgi:hypothetical protein
LIHPDSIQGGMTRRFSPKPSQPQEPIVPAAVFFNIAWLDSIDPLTRRASFPNMVSAGMDQEKQASAGDRPRYLLR